MAKGNSTYGNTIVSTPLNQIKGLNLIMNSLMVGQHKDVLHPDIIIVSQKLKQRIDYRNLQSKLHQMVRNFA